MAVGDVDIDHNGNEIVSTTGAESIENGDYGGCCCVSPYCCNNFDPTGISAGMNFSVVQSGVSRCFPLSTCTATDDGNWVNLTAWNGNGSGCYFFNVTRNAGECGQSGGYSTMDCGATPAFHYDVWGDSGCSSILVRQVDGVGCLPSIVFLTSASPPTSPPPYTMLIGGDSGPNDGPFYFSGGTVCARASFTVSNQNTCSGATPYPAGQIANGSGGTVTIVPGGC